MPRRPHPRPAPGHRGPRRLHGGPLGLAAAAMSAGGLSLAVLIGAAAPGASAETVATAAPTTTATPTAAAGPTPPPAAASTTTGRTYYLNCSARTAGDGHLATPWNALGAVNAHTFGPGDRMLVKRGTTCSGRLHPKGSGTRGKPVVLGAYPAAGSKPTIAGHGTPNGTATVQLTNQHDWSVQDLHITNAGSARNTTIYRSGLLLQNVHGGRLPGLTAQRLTIDSVWSNPGPKHANYRSWGGISVLTRGWAKDGFDGLVIRANRLANLGRTGVIVANSEYPHGSDRNVRITGNTVRHVRGDSIVLGGVVGGRVDHNVSAWGGELGACSTRQCGRRGGPTTASAAIWPILSKNIVIEHNEVYGEQADSGDGEAFDVDLSTRNIVIQDNYAHDNEGGGIMLCGAKETSVRFNILQNNAKAAFTFTCANKVDGVRIYNNTVYQKRSVVASAVVRTLRGFGGTRIAFLNNIVYTWGPGHYTFPSKPVASYNTFVGTHHRTEPTGTGNSRRAPGLRSPGSGRVGMRTLGGYHLRTLTGAQKGHVLPASVTQDLFGGRVNPSAPHRGASNTTR